MRCIMPGLAKQLLLRAVYGAALVRQHHIAPPLITECVFKKSKSYEHRTAVVDSDGHHTYQQLHNKSLSLSSHLLRVLGPPPREIEHQKHVCLLLPPSALYVVAQWAVWITGNVVIPLCPDHPAEQLKYFMRDSSSTAIITCPKLLPALPKLSGVETITLSDELFSEPPQSSEYFGVVPNDSRAMILYTSGTTGSPKGVVLSHGNLSAQMYALTQAWQYSASDVILNCLPLHHTHGVVNALLTPLNNGGRVILTRFNAQEVWNQMLGSHTDDTGQAESVNLFMGVPTMYAKLIQHYDQHMRHSDHLRAFVKESCKQNIRLMVSGSAALPEPVLERWKVITGHTLLERYGMTEIGMALTNPLNGDRRPGFVGQPFTNVSVRVVNELNQVLSEGTTVTPGCKNTEGELLVKGPNVFKEYWKRPKATKKEFTCDGWFKTGDTAVCIDGSYKILGRSSVDIIKTGGFKVSALQVEKAILDHESVTDVAVVGVEDITWGQKIVAVLVLSAEHKEGFDSKKMSLWLQDKLPKYQIPAQYLLLPELPRNNMGKVNKKQLVSDLFSK